MATRAAIFSEMLYKEWLYRDITKVCEPMHTFRALSYLALTSQVLTFAVWLQIVKKKPEKYKFSVTSSGISFTGA